MMSSMKLFLNLPYNMTHCVYFYNAKETVLLGMFSEVNDDNECYTQNGYTGY